MRHACPIRISAKLVQQRIVKIDPAAKRVTTDTETHAPDHLVVALGADYDWEATPGLADVHEFYTAAGGRKAYETSFPILRAAVR